MYKQAVHLTIQFYDFSSMDTLHTYEFELSVDLLFRLRVLCTYFKHLMAKDFPGLTTGSPLRHIRIELPVADPEYEYHNLCWREPGRTSDGITLSGTIPYR